jgi:maltokinase
MTVVPELRSYEANLRSCYQGLEQLGGALLTQRIHGDYHLGQVLAANGRWMVIDFEGEPAVPLARRRAFAPVLRDVAGMLRSFDYASRQPFMDGTVQGRMDEAVRKRAQSWARDCQDAFCDGYASASGAGLSESSHLLKAFLMQKAVYEAVYEARHRPSWTQIPMSAIAEAFG